VTTHGDYSHIIKKWGSVIKLFTKPRILEMSRHSCPQKVSTHLQYSWFGKTVYQV